MTNTNLLIHYINDSGIKKGKIAEKLGITYGALWQKIHNIRDFKASEIKTLCDLLRINSLTEKDRIFFASEGE